MTPELLVSVDLGGTKILTALINSNNEIISRLKISTNYGKGPESLVKSIAESVKKILSDNCLDEESVKAICMGVPGMLNPISGLISNAPNLQIKDFNIKDAMSKEIACRVLIENDVNLAGLGIKKFELGEDAKNILIVFIGTGIGSALFFNGKIYRGSSFFAGELGHILVNQKGMFTTRNGKSTFEGIASRIAITRDIQKALMKGKKSVLKEYKSNVNSLKSKTLASAVLKEDQIACKYVSRASVAIGNVLASLTTLLNLDTIVLGGGVIEAMPDFIMPIIKDTFFEGVLPEAGKYVRIFETKLGDDAPLYGGVVLAEEFFG